MVIHVFLHLMQVHVCCSKGLLPLSCVKQSHKHVLYVGSSSVQWLRTVSTCCISSPKCLPLTLPHSSGAAWWRKMRGRKQQMVAPTVCTLHQPSCNSSNGTRHTVGAAQVCRQHCLPAPRYTDHWWIHRVPEVCLITVLSQPGRCRGYVHEV
jgi:hypothetical protein